MAQCLRRFYHPLWRQNNVRQDARPEGQSAVPSLSSKAQRTKSGERLARTGTSYRRVPKIELGVHLPDGRCSTGDPSEDYINLLVEAVDRQFAVECFEEELRFVESSVVELQYRIDEIASFLTLVKPRMSDAPILTDYMDEESGNADGACMKMDDLSNQRRVLSKRTAQCNQTLSKLMGIILGSAQSFLDSIGDDGYVKSLHVNEDLAYMIKYTAECSAMLCESEASKVKAMQQYQEALNMAQTAKIISNGAREPAESAALRASLFCESVKTVLRARLQAADRKVARQKQNQRHREGMLLKGLSLPALMAAGRFRIPRPPPISEASSTYNLTPVYGQYQGLEGDPERFEEEELVSSQQGQEEGEAEPDMSMRFEAREVIELRNTRREAATARRQLIEHIKVCQKQLGKHLYVHPESNHVAWEARVKLLKGLGPEEVGRDLEHIFQDRNAVY